MSITSKQSADLWELNLEGEITLSCVAEVRERLLEALDATDHVSLGMGKVSRVDLSCLQIFCALHKTSIARGKRISFSAPLPVLVKETMERTGYLSEAGCHRKKSGDCLMGGASYE